MRNDVVISISRIYEGEFCDLTKIVFAFDEKHTRFLEKYAYDFGHHLNNPRIGNGAARNPFHSYVVYTQSTVALFKKKYLEKVFARHGKEILRVDFAPCAFFNNDRVVDFFMKSVVLTKNDNISLRILIDFIETSEVPEGWYVYEHLYNEYNKDTVYKKMYKIEQNERLYSLIKDFCPEKLLFMHRVRNHSVFYKLIYITPSLKKHYLLSLLPQSTRLFKAYRPFVDDTRIVERLKKNLPL